MPLNPANVPEHISTHFRTPDELLKRSDIVTSQLYEWNAKENPNYPLFVYYDGSQRQYITYSTANRAMDRAARYVASSVGGTVKEANTKPPVVALLAITGACRW